MTVRAWKVRTWPSGSRYSTPSARPSRSVSTRSTRQWVRRSRRPLARAWGTDVSPGFHRSSWKEPKPALHGRYRVAGSPLYGTLFTHTGVGYGCSPEVAGRAAEQLALAGGPQRRHRVVGVARNERVGVPVAGHSGDPLGQVVVGLEVGVAQRPVDDRAVLRQHIKAPVRGDVAAEGELVGMHASQGAAPVHDRAADPVHHPTEAEGDGAGGLAVVAPPAGGLGQELRPHVAPAVVGGAELVRTVVVAMPPTAGLEPDHAHARVREQGGDETADGPHPDDDHVGRSGWFRSGALRVVPGDRRAAAPRLLRRAGSPPRPGNGSRRSWWPDSRRPARPPSARATPRGGPGTATRPCPGFRRAPGPRTAPPAGVPAGCGRTRAGRGPGTGELAGLEAGDDQVLLSGRAVGEAGSAAFAGHPVERVESELVGLAQVPVVPGERAVEVADGADADRARPWTPAGNMRSKTAARQRAR